VIVASTSIPRCTVVANAYILLVDSKTTGNVKSTVGKMEEAIGNATGLESLETSGKKRQAEGDVEFKQAQAQGYVKGTMDYVAGTVEDVKGSFTGDSSQEVSGGCFGFLQLLSAADNGPMIGKVRKEKGKVQQDANES